MSKAEVFVTDRVPETWTGRRRRAKPDRPKPLPEVVPIYEPEFLGHPGSIRVSFEDGSTAMYDIRIEQPHPIIVENINIIRKWNGYNNQPMRRRRKP